MTKRKSITLSIRFEVFKRARFRCQYCGVRQTDDGVVLHVDHVVPVFEGGTNDIVNLVAACASCNLGKGATRLDDHVALAQSLDRLEDIQHRRDNLQLMARWHEECRHEVTESVALIMKCWSEWSRCPAMPDDLQAVMSEHIRAWIRTFGALEVLEGVRIAVDRYVQFGVDGQPVGSSLAQSWQKIGGVCATRRAQQRGSLVSRLKYIRGILSNRFGDHSPGVYDAALPVLRDAASRGVAVELIEKCAKHACSWSQFLDSLDDEADNLRSVEQSDES